MAPIGWPSAIAPPLTLTLSRSSSEVADEFLGDDGESLVDFEEVDVVGLEARPWRAPSSRQAPARSASASGQSPMLAVATMRARGFKPVLLRRRPCEVSRIAAAPSTTPDELPAWWMWLNCFRSGYFWLISIAHRWCHSASTGIVSPDLRKGRLQAGEAFHRRLRTRNSSWSSARCHHRCRPATTDFAEAGLHRSRWRRAAARRAAEFVDAPRGSMPSSVAIASAQTPCCDCGCSPT